MAALPKIRKKTTSSRPPLRAVPLPPVAPPPRRPSDYPPPTARRESSGPHRRSDLPPPAPLPARLLEQYPRFSDDVPTARRSLNDFSYSEETATERLPNGSYDEWAAGSDEEDRGHAQ